MIQTENSSNGTSDNTILNIIINLFKSLFTVITTLLKIILNAAINLIGGLLRIIGAVIAIILLFLAGTQTVLTLGAILMLFLGVMSKYGIKALSIIGAPIFAIIAAQLSISLGTVIGGISTVIFSILAILLLFALPISIAALIYFILGGTEENNNEELNIRNIDFNLDRTGPLYMMLSIIMNSIDNST
jgi:hypothetical protein